MKTRQSRKRPGATGSNGQTLVEFALVLPIFIFMLLAIIEFCFVFNAVLTANYATRDASLIAAEAGSTAGADCVIIDRLLDDVTAPVNAENLSQIIIYRARPSGAPFTGDYTTSGNVWTRSSSNTTNCSAYGGSATLPFVRTTTNYPEGQVNLVTGAGGRCDFLNGCPNNTLRPRDAVGVQMSYDYQWHTPLRFLFNASGSGFTIIRSNEMRMEPIL